MKEDIDTLKDDWLTDNVQLYLLSRDERQLIGGPSVSHFGKSRPFLSRQHLYPINLNVLKNTKYHS